MTFADVQRRPVVLDAGTIADWIAARLFPESTSACDARWAASADACEHLERRHCTFPTSKSLRRETLHAAAARVPRIPRGALQEVESKLEPPLSQSRLDSALLPEGLGAITRKDAHVVQLALASTAAGVLTTDTELARGIRTHSELRTRLDVWHVLDAAAELPAEARRSVRVTPADPRKPRSSRKRRRRR